MITNVHAQVLDQSDNLIPALYATGNIGGEKDYDHPKRTSFEVHALIKGSRLVEPPWPEDAWEQAMAAMMAGTGALFGPWVQGAQLLVDFFKE